MNISNWTPERQTQLERLAAKGKTARQAAIIMKTTRNAVLGRANRTGVTFAGAWTPAKAKPLQDTDSGRRHTPEWKAAQGARTRELWATGRMSKNAIPHTTRVAAVAAHLAGLSRVKAGAAFGTCEPSIVNWERIPAIVMEARALAERALADLAEQRAEIARVKAEQKAVESAARAERNAPVLAGLPPRTRRICELYLDGATLQEIGNGFKFTRERARQIVGDGVRAGLDTGGRFTGKPAGYVPTGKPRVKRGHRKSYRISPEERARRSVAMRNMWATRGLANVAGAGRA